MEVEHGKMVRVLPTECTPAEHDLKFSGPGTPGVICKVDCELISPGVFVALGRWDSDMGGKEKYGLTK